ncbi:stage II sporulation protein D [Bacillus shivajii]|uniref:stage II sporulation protein D n=1 Tax=Bacillus shivajii TaxID=1983719 RepID=UPI001CF9D63C|nr:stage II sporulation protein D [Bacillus shivajii]UCZ55407.1 stage II sporulation protein D [Bacillus shivajii]
MKQLVFFTLLLMVVLLVIPSILVVAFQKDEPGLSTYERVNDEEPEPVIMGEAEEVEYISVFRAEQEIIEDVPFEEYIAGVVASEMPATYEMEALKAQALTARTYIIKLLTTGTDINLPDGANVTDTVMHQVYKNKEELIERWGSDYEWKMARVKQAVYETGGKIITYNGEPITAAYFSTSNGYTENSEEYWKNEIPYLRSVESPWDKSSPRYAGEKILSVQEFEKELNVNINNGPPGEIMSRTTGGRVAEVNIGGIEFTGREVRDLLDLDSSDFDWERQGNMIRIETRGWGHGVGMSQFGADQMAKDGYDYKEIISHYYQDVEIDEAEDVLGLIIAHKNRPTEENGEGDGEEQAFAN